MRMRDSTILLCYCGQARSKQGSTGALLSDWFESPPCKKAPATKVVGAFLAEDEGFEPPQTESESGVLPLHKSSMNRTVVLYPIFSKSQAHK